MKRAGSGRIDPVGGAILGVPISFSLPFPPIQAEEERKERKIV